MFTLHYSPFGQNPWTPFHTGPEIFQASNGDSLIDAFGTAQDAENVVSEWFANGQPHWPVAMWDSKKQMFCLMYDSEAWPLKLAVPADVHLCRWPWASTRLSLLPQSVVVVV